MGRKTKSVSSRDSSTSLRGVALGRDATAFRDQDFISFDLLEPEPALGPNSLNAAKNGKGKGKERSFDGDDSQEAAEVATNDSARRAGWRRQGTSASAAAENFANGRSRPSPGVPANGVGRGKSNRAGSGKKRKRDEEAQTAQTDRGTPWAEEVDWATCHNAAAALHREIIAFDRYIAPTVEEHATRKMAIELIRQAVTNRFKDAQVHSFGSQETQLYLPQGDIDLVCLSQEMTRIPDRKCLRTLANVLRQNNIASQIAVIQAKVPIVKFTCLPSLGNFKVDISINRQNGIAAAKFVNEWLDRQPAVRPLVMCIKCLLSQRGMAEVFSGGLGSFSVILMTISFLQLHPKMQRKEIDPCENLGVLLLEFLELYGKNFGYDNVAITVREDGGYFSKPRNGWKDERKPFLLSIEDPLDSTNDISKGSWNILEVRQLFASTFDILTSACCKRAMDMRIDPTLQNLMPRSTHTRYDEDDLAREALISSAKGGDSGGLLRKDPRSLLGNVFGTSRSVQRSRAELLRLFQSGSMQRRLKQHPPGTGPLPGPSSSTIRSKEKEDARKQVQVGTELVTGGGTTAGQISSELMGVNERAAESGTGCSSGREKSKSVDIVDEEELANSQGYFFDIHGLSQRSAGDDDDDASDSRYAQQPPRKRKHIHRSSPPTASAAEGNYIADSDSESGNDDDTSLPTLVCEARATPTSRASKSKVSAQDRRDFWASKTTHASRQQSPADGSKEGDGSEEGEAPSD
ncbi:hypothetical protein K437DRAFT_274333 [Tilletiaria anomala UBC 951]|uniref:polynucleotide adenylyltransferase n=1 Tax=Tilletiaria anomala (strain ATCC 24038 / CBS 436.72 / UBC 951) TaxID=1037660 RepID=A0A066VTM4_TILAU|nr:uncharacterized protein K437DRAFT_274333 [Tilletiaria anomala UBC 951]KDN45077.1 hypothetical protein K437DRAFT_274333 [Tilletiaria anomala UBC 951]